MRLIDADALMTWFDNHYDDEEVTVGFVSGLIKEQPTIEPERKKGEWIRLTKDLAKCSVCEDYIDNAISCGYNYCPNCGSDMRGGRTDG